MIYVGTGSAAEDKILFKHNTFHLKDQDDGNKPVLRVTYHGARMYAQKYGQELLTEDEWRFGYLYHLQNAVQQKPATSQVEGESDVNMMSNRVPPQKKSGPGVLDDMGQTVKEWVHVTNAPGNGKPEVSGGDILVSGIMDRAIAEGNGRALVRFPWEGFSDVGFRTKILIVKNK
jgi:formylglycine-generating enzyme required for sulfatase activity